MDKELILLEIVSNMMENGLKISKLYLIFKKILILVNSTDTVQN